MTTTQTSLPIVRTINYPAPRNCVGLSPVSGMLDDPTPTMRARWALLFGERGVEPAYAATYGETVVETTHHADRARIYAKLGRSGYVGKHRNNRCETVEFPIVTEHYKIGGAVVDSLPEPWRTMLAADLSRSAHEKVVFDHLRSLNSAGVPLDEPGDILLSEHDVLEDNCPECGSNGNCVRSCPVGGEL